MTHKEEMYLRSLIGKTVVGKYSKTPYIVATYRLNYDRLILTVFKKSGWGYSSGKSMDFYQYDKIPNTSRLWNYTLDELILPKLTIQEKLKTLVI